jgi:hypothetical protein
MFNIREANIVNRKFSFWSVVIVLVLFVSFNPSEVSANTILSYTGSNYSSVVNGPYPGAYTTSMHISATFELSNDLGPGYDWTIDPIHFSLSDGVHTLTDSTPGVGTLFYFMTDGTGAVQSWTFAGTVQTPGFNDIHSDGSYLPGVDSSNQPIPFYINEYAMAAACDLGCSADVASSSTLGTWTSTRTSVPEPSSLGMLAIGLAGLGFQLRKRI